ncbi:hypothetical protein MKX01_028820 [Papaver californicum]|nr:hypothetical protein MKX01_028820 [Papaver californicum]
MYSSRVFRGCRALMAAAKSTATKPSGGSTPAAPKGILKFLGGIPEASRTDAIKKIWVYIKAFRVVRILMAFKSIFDSAALRNELEKAGINTSFIPLIWKYVIKNPKCEFDEIPSLPLVVYPLLQSKFKTSTSTVDIVLEID